MMREFQNQHLDATERIAQSILRINQKDLVALQVLGLSLAMQGRIPEAVVPLTKAASLDGKNPELLNNLAKAQQGAELYAQALETYQKLNRLVQNNPQILTDMGTAYGKLGQFDKASACYEMAINLAPNYFLAWSNQGNLLVEQGLPEQALVSYENALQLNPSYAETWTNYGNALYDLGRFEESLKAHEKALTLNPLYGEAWSNQGNTLQELKRGEESLQSYQMAYELVPEHPFLIGQLLNAYTTQCEWNQSQELIERGVKEVAQLKSAIPPFILLQTPASLEHQKKAAQVYIQKRVHVINSGSIPLSSPIAGRKIRIGYFSSDLKDHPVGILMEHIIRLHDRGRFEVIGVTLNKPTSDALESRLAKSFDRMIPLHGLNDAQACEIVREQQFDIAIDLNGHTANARTGLFGLKLAPVQVNYLGYAGTLGADFYDYLVCDQIAVPPEHQSYYVEKLACMPHSFFPADSIISHEEFGPIPSRQSQGLPDSGFVFASFNNSYKITPQIFDVWMELLKQTPGSVLWLSKPSAAAIANLKQHSHMRGVDSNRILFAERVPSRVDHLSRLRLADLFLDTPYFNAHTTAADALWAGLPVLTILGDTFAGRVAASQLTALDMPELISESMQSYYSKALEYSHNPELLKQIKNKLCDHRLTKSLFDTHQYVKDLEALYISFVEEKS